MILAACADPGSHVPSAVPGATLLTHRGSENGAYPAALGQGRLVIRDGCVAMRSGGGGATSFILWAPGFGLRERDGRTEVIDPEGNLVAAIGDPITLGGGYFDLGCRGPGR